MKPKEEILPQIPKKSFSEMKELLPSILNESDLNKQLNAWTELKNSKTIQQFASANLRTYPVSLQMLEQRTSLSAQAIFGNDEVELDDFKYATLYVGVGSTAAAIGSLAFLPPNVGATFCYLFALVPIVFIAIGSTSPGIIASGITLLRGANSDTSKDKNGNVVSTFDRRCRHEAAHFCCGYWCGLPVRSYEIQSGMEFVK